MITFLIIFIVSQLELFQDETQISSFISLRSFYRFRDKSDFVSPYTIGNRAFLKVSTPILDGNANIAGDFYYKTSFTELSQSVILSLREANFKKDFGVMRTAIGVQVNSWGRTDFSPVDVLNPPNLSELFFNDIEVLRVPMFQLLIGFPVLKQIDIELIYEPFFEPAFLPSMFSEWSYIIGSQDSERVNILRNTLGDVGFNVKKPSFPQSSQFGGSIYSKNIGVYLFYGLEHIPPPSFETGLRGSLNSQNASITKKLKTMSIEELAEPVLSVNQPPVELKPARYFMIGTSLEKEFNGTSLKSDVAFFLGRQFLNERFETVKNPQLQVSVQAERFFGKHFFIGEVVPSVIFVDNRIPEKNYRFLGQRALNTQFISNLISRWRKDFLTYITFVMAPQDEWGYVARFQIETELWKVKVYPNISLFGNLGGEDSDIGSLKNKSFIGLWAKHYIM